MVDGASHRAARRESGARVRVCTCGRLEPMKVSRKHRQGRLRDDHARQVDYVW